MRVVATPLRAPARRSRAPTKAPSRVSTIHVPGFVPGRVRRPWTASAASKAGRVAVVCQAAATACLAAGRSTPACVSACNFDPLRRGIGVQF